MYITGKTTVPPWTTELRRWQADCRRVLFERLNAGQQTQAVSVIMGAGKTMLILCWLHGLLESRRARLGVIVVPTDNLRLQFCRDAKTVGIRAYAVTSKPDAHPNREKRVSCIRALDAALPGDAHAIVMTYAQLATEDNIQALQAIAREAPVAFAFDEVHHSGDGMHEDDSPLSWGDGSLRAAAPAVARLLTTATPNRTDNRPIPFMRYTDERVPVFDYTYDYEAALIDKYVRPVDFTYIDGDVSWWEPSGSVSAKLSDPIPVAQQSRRLNTALDPDFEWVDMTLDRAHRCLEDIRTRLNHPDAGGLAVVRSKEDAKRIERKLVQRGARVVVVTYDDPNASQKIDAFRDSADHWIVAVRMVSEGVDIKRLRVIAYCTNVTTDLLFLQILGRILRVINGITPQMAHMFIPHDPRIARIVDAYRHMVARALKIREEREAEKGKDRQPPIWYGESATGIESGRIIDGARLAQSYIDAVRPHSQGSHTIETAAAMALQMVLSGSAPAPAPQPVASPKAWDAEKHDLCDRFKQARSKLKSVRIRGGVDKKDAAISVNHEISSMFGSWKDFQHDVEIVRRALDWLNKRITAEEAWYAGRS